MLAGHELPVTGHEQLLQLAAAIEGHPDNVAPAIYGGLQLGVKNNDRWWTRSKKKIKKTFFLSQLISIDLFNNRNQCSSRFASNFVCS